MTVRIMQEDKGLAKIYQVCAEMDAIWRATPCHDLGVDGQIEFLEPNSYRSTGYIVVVQSKSGSSYFKNKNKNIVKYYPKRKHREYWGRLTLPVLLVLHDPERDITIYTPVKSQLVGNNPIILNERDLFCPSARQDLLGIVREEVAVFPPASILAEFKTVRLERDNGKILSGIEFLLASANITSGYFELRMCRIKALFSLIASPGEGIVIGAHDYSFIHRNVLKCLSLNLTAPFLKEFEHSWYDLSMVPDIAVPFSQVGRDVLSYLWAHLDEYFNRETFSSLKIKNSLKLAKLISTETQAASDHLDQSDNLGEVSM